MDEELRQSLAKRLGLPDDATEEQIKTELAKPVEDPPTPTGGEGEPVSGEPPAVTDPNPVVEGDPVSATVTLDRATYDQLKRGADLAVTHETERVEARINETVEAAVMDGRIPPARREHWQKALRADFDGNKTVIDGLEKGLVPLVARGSGGGGGEGDGLEAGTDQGLPLDWFPEIKTIRAQAESGSRVINAKEG